MSKFALPLIYLLLVIAVTEPLSHAQNFDSANLEPVPSRVVERVDASKLTLLRGNTHPDARSEFDVGLVNPGNRLERILLVLKRSPEQETALAAFNERQYDPKSPDYHRWLHSEEFGQLYGPSDADITQITSWLENQGFQINGVGRGKVFIDFSGTVAQVQDAFHLEMHRYLVNGKEHIANDRNPQIPTALAPVITGIASLNDFFPKHLSHFGGYVKRDLKTGKYTPVEPASTSVDGLKTQANGLKGNPSGPMGIQPEFGYTDTETGYLREMLSPYDVATIYNILPLWNESTPNNGTSVKVAIIALSDVETSDFNTFRSSFGLPAGTLTTLHSGADPGITASQGENTEDVEMVSSTAPGAQVILVADVDSATTDGLQTAVNYVVDNEIAPILTMSYGACELDLGTSGNSLYNQIFQQGATQGISSFVAAGDSGSTVCTSQDGTPPYADTVGLAVSGMASTPYVTAVGGTDVQWYLTESTHPPSTYWNATNDANGASAKGYMPEMAWNDTCSNPLLLNVYTAYSNNEELCNAAISADPGLVEMASGSGGVSKCTEPTGTTSSSCAGGYAKPSWQTGVTGIPADGKRDIPDVSMFAAYGYQSSTGIPGSALLICMASSSPETSCDYSNPDYIIYQENGGTSAASPLTAGIMALIVQRAGGAKQGLANPVFYSLAAKQNYAACNSNTIAAGNSCIFDDVTTGSNASVCVTGAPNCVTNRAGDEAGIVSGYSAGSGYDLTTGLGTFNVANLVKAWPVGTSAPAVSLSPTSIAFPSTLAGATSAAQMVTIKNSGTAALTLTSETLTGTGAASFVKSATTCETSLAAGASCTVSVEFKPAAAGSFSAALAIADNATGSSQSVALTGTGTKPATTPVFSPVAGTYAAKQSVTITDTTSGAIIYYTTNGSTPTTSSTKYTGAISVAATETLEAIAVATGYTNSAVGSAKYTIETPAATPVFSPAPGTYAAKQSVTITDATSGAIIYYTTNGSTPTTSSTKYTGAISVAATETLEAIAVATGYTNSAVGSAKYTIVSPAATPVFSVPSGSYSAAQSVQISDPTPGATIYYTTNGAAPTPASAVYKSAVSVSATEYLQAIAVADGYTNSPIATALYSIGADVTATPVLSPPPGAYGKSQTVTITDATPGAVITYSVGIGSAVNTYTYTGPFTVSSTEYIAYDAIAPGYTRSAALEGIYTIGSVPTPQFSPAAGTYSTAQAVNIYDITPSASIYYTTDGTTPTTTSAVYTGPVIVTANQTIRAFAVATGLTSSAPLSSAYTIGKGVATPAFSLAPGS